MVGIRKSPGFWIWRRLKFVRTEDSPLLARPCHLQDQSDFIVGSLEIRDSDTMNSAGESEAAPLYFRRMKAIVVDYQLFVDVEHRAIV